MSRKDGAIKGKLHPRNRHQGKYDLDRLCQEYPPLKRHIIVGKHGEATINFFDPIAVKALNSALLALCYGVTKWDIPATSLVPPIPGRADYIHYLADIIGTGEARCLDIGVGANCIYPIIGTVEYGWEFVGSDIDSDAIENARSIVSSNDALRGKIELRHQFCAENIFKGIVDKDEHFDIALCNPPFHDSATSAEEGTRRKLRNLKARDSKSNLELNFGGNSNELWCRGGELLFITKMIRESRQFSHNCRYFTTLVSKESNLPKLVGELGRVKATDYRIIDMSQGNKRSRILAWYF